MTATGGSGSGNRTIIRAFAAGAACGMLAGILAAALLLPHLSATWQAWMRPQDTARTSAPVTHGPDPSSPGPVDTRQTPSEAAHRPLGTAGASAGEAREPAAPSGDAAVLAGRDLAIPVEGVRPDQLVRTFDEARGERQHEALDIIAPRHTPVLAVEDGRVARLFESKAGGITIYQFDRDEQYCYYYAHLERYADGLAEGQQVRKGQVIGYVGTSGNAPRDTPHLHFAIFRLGEAKRWWEGTPLDPYDVLR